MAKNNQNGPKYHIDIEGTIHPWDEDTITTEQVIQLGGWDQSQGAVIIDDKTQVERTLQPGEVIEVKPGIGFAKKVTFKRGLISPRVEAELNILQKQFEGSTFKDGWVKIPSFKLPSDMGWNIETIDVAFQIPVGYPGTPPYGLYVPSGLRINQEPPNDFQPVAANKPPFEGEWGMISWAIESEWKINADVTKGTNLLNVVYSFHQRFRLGK